MGFVMGRTTRLELGGVPLCVEEDAVSGMEEDPVETEVWERAKRVNGPPPSDRRFDARIVALEAVARIAAKDEEPAVILSVAEQLEDWLMRPGPAGEESDIRTAPVFGYDETRGMRGWPSWARGA